MAENKSTEARISALELTVNNLLKENAALKRLVQKEDGEPEPEKLVIPDTSFTVDGKQYKFLVPRFQYKKELITAIDALATPEILADLVAKKSGLIKEVF